jgi:integrase
VNDGSEREGKAMAIYRYRNSRNWYASIYLGKDRPRIQKSLHTDDEEKARALEQALIMAHKGSEDRDKIVALVDQLMGTGDRPRLSLTAAWDVYEGLPGLKIGDHTRRVRLSHFKRFVDYCATDWPRVEYLDQVTRPVAFGFADSWRPKCRTGKTYNNLIRNMQTVFQKLMYRAGLHENVWRLLESAPTDDSTSGRAFTDEEIARILKQCKRQGDYWREISTVALYTGLRYSDIKTLRWDQVTGDELTLAPKKTKRHGIGVAVPLHPRLVRILERLPRDDEFVFPSHAHRPRQGEMVFTKKILAKAGIRDDKAKLSFHCWRHTFRTRLAAAGVAKEIVQKLGGWKTDISELYNHDTTQLRRAIDRLS